jgi:cell division control protein 45
LTFQVQTFLDTRQIETAGPFLHAAIHEGSPFHKYFSHPNCLTLLAQHTLKAYNAFTSSKKVSALPLVLSAPLDADEGTCIVVGVPPVSDRSRRNLLGTAFEQALKRTGCRYRLDYFDPSVIQLKTEDRAKFINGLISLLQ